MKDVRDVRGSNPESADPLHIMSGEKGRIRCGGISQWNEARRYESISRAGSVTFAIAVARSAEGGSRPSWGDAPTPDHFHRLRR